MSECVQYGYYSEVEAKNINWLWYPYIPYGKLTILQGDPGEGKSTFVLQLAAILTKGGVLPSGETVGKPCNVVYQCAEDNLEDTIKPRLVDAGADCSKMVFIDDSECGLTLDDERIRTTLIATKAKLLVLDPIQAFIPQDCDMQSATRIRSVLRKLAAVAAECECAVVLVGHMNKASGGKKLYRGLGSIDIAAIARSVLMIVRDEDFPEKRYVCHIKSNLAEEGQPIGFELCKESGFRWMEMAVGGNAFPVLQGNKNDSKKAIAKNVLMKLLGNGPRPSVEIYKRMAQIDISERTVRSAGKEMGIKAIKHGREWYWSFDSVEKQKENMAE